MKKEEFFTRIETGECMTYGCISAYKSKNDYYCGRSSGTIVFDCLEDLWLEIGHFWLYSIDRTKLDINLLSQLKAVNKGSLQRRYRPCNSFHRKKAEKGSLSSRQIKIFRACHHEFEGLTQIEAAKKLKCNVATINRALKHVKKILPQYFPILIRLEYKCYNYYMNEGWSVKEIAEYLNKIESSVYAALARAKAKGMWWAGPAGRKCSWDALKEQYGDNDEGCVDEMVKQKF